MEKTILGTKLNMTQLFLDSGKVVPVTIIRTTEEITEELKDREVLVVGTSKGKGFSGVMKRWNFKGGQRTRGQSDKPRAPGSVGSQTPGRVYKGKKMAGKHGNDRVTVKGLKIVEIIKDTNEFMVSGPVPGARNSKVEIKLL